MTRKNNPVRSRPQTRQLPTIDLAELLHGKPAWADVVEFWQHGEFDDEPYLVDAIRKHLLTPAQQQVMERAEFTIVDLLNGHTRFNQGQAVRQITTEWNKKLGFKAFYSGADPQAKPVTVQDQRALTDQLHTLRVLANQNGLYDAADWLQTHLQQMRKS